MRKTVAIENRSNLPVSPGVYWFLDDTRKPIYIGRATNLRSRVASYFSTSNKRGEWIAKMVSSAKFISFEMTETVLESVIVEANRIKQFAPKYNTDLKDNKSFAYIAVTKEAFPRFVFVREREVTETAFSSTTKKYRRFYGPYTSKKNAEIVLKIARKIFPFHSSSILSEKGCLHFQIGLCPGPYAGAISRSEYRRNIRNVEYILRGQRSRLLATLEKEMIALAKEGKFEEAAKRRDELFALRHIRDTALLGERRGDSEIDDAKLVVEAYDISHISGDFSVASMVVFRGEKPEKEAYRKFNIKTIQGIDDIAMMREVLTRRLRHSNWGMPDVIVLDGGATHLAMAEKLFEDLSVSKSVGLLAVAKGPTRNKVDVYASKRFVPNFTIVRDRRFLETVREEAHRFAITFHRVLRKKAFREKLS
jgi:excinuclease ABC subunit C